MTSPSQSVVIQNGKEKQREQLDHLRVWIKRFLVAKVIVQECMIIMAVIGVGSYIIKFSPETALMYLFIIFVWFGISFVTRLNRLSKSVQTHEEFDAIIHGAIRDGVMIFSTILLFVILTRIANGATTPEDVLAASLVGFIFLILCFLVVAALLLLSKHEELKLLEGTTNQVEN